MAEEMKTLTIGSDTFKVVDGEAVHCCAQTLTEEQKAQARANIGAAAEGSGGGSAASDPVVFTMNPETGEATCSKTYDECLALVSNGNFDAVMNAGMGDSSAYFKSAMVVDLGGMIIYGFANAAMLASGEPLSLTVFIVTPDGVTMN